MWLIPGVGTGVDIHIFVVVSMIYLICGMRHGYDMLALRLHWFKLNGRYIVQKHDWITHNSRKLSTDRHLFMHPIYSLHLVQFVTIYHTVPIPPHPISFINHPSMLIIGEQHPTTYSTLITSCSFVHTSIRTYSRYVLVNSGHHSHPPRTSLFHMRTPKIS